MAVAPFEIHVDIAWGHCDRAGITYYPNYFRWFDAAYHAFLKSRGLDQRALAERLGTMGTGLIDAGASFQAPISYGDRLMLTLTIEAWSEKTVRLAYVGRCDGRIVMQGHELRGLFIREGDSGTIRAAAIAPLRQMIEL